MDHIHRRMSFRFFQISNNFKSFFFKSSNREVVFTILEAVGPVGVELQNEADETLLQ